MSNYRFLDYELSETDFCLSREGQRIALEPKALRVLTLLVSRAGRLVDKQELLTSIWPNTFVEENTLTRTIAVLRRQLGDSSRDSKLIETVPTRGYRFIAAVEMVPAPSALEPNGQTTAPSAVVVDAASEPASEVMSNSLPPTKAELPKAIGSETGEPGAKSQELKWPLIATFLILVAGLGFGSGIVSHIQRNLSAIWRYCRWTICHLVTRRVISLTE